MPRLVWSRLDPLAELREAFEGHPNLTLETTRFRGEDHGILTRIWWRDVQAGRRGPLAEATDAQLVPVTTDLIGQLMRLRRGRAKGAGA